MSFTPLPSLLGGVLLSVATSSLMVDYGRVLGVSGIAHSVSSDPIYDRISSSSKPATDTGRPWKVACFAGLLAGGVLLRLGEGRVVRFVGAGVFHAPGQGGPVWRTVTAGLLVGLGTKLGSGCTSGHMLCGLARLSIRSAVATASFFASALVTAQLLPSTLPAFPAASSSPIFSLSTVLLLFAPTLLSLLSPLLLSPSRTTLFQSFSAGVQFALGLALAGMTRPSKVLAFFAVPVPFAPLYGQREWDPSLAMVALGGLLPNMFVWQRIKFWSKPRRAAQSEVPTRRDITVRLVLGSVLFGIGWGLSGLCPGPAFTVLGSSNLAMVPFLVSFAVGGVLGNAI